MARFSRRLVYRASIIFGVNQVHRPSLPFGRFFAGDADLVPFRDGMRGKYPIEMPKQQVILSINEQEHSGEGFNSLWLTVFEISTCKVEKFPMLRKFDLDFS